MLLQIEIVLWTDSTYINNDYKKAQILNLMIP